MASINSGSNGNCYYVGNEQDAVLVDVGLSCKEIEKRMATIGLSMKTVRAILITHEHTDHVKGLTKLANKYHLPIYITEPTAKGIYLIKHLSKSFEASQPFTVQSLTIQPFVKQHDAIHPHSFTITSQGITVGVFTDIGSVCHQLIHHFKQCHAAFLESNYCEEMLEAGPYPWVLKNRIRGGQGHLSNKQALELFVQHRPSFMSHLLLSHLSKENNTPELAISIFAPHASNVQLHVASRYEPSEVFVISGDDSVGASRGVVGKQMVLF
jgi:phosphoribosyl 1,2-cyclic phosphodiesterase